jgi:2-polyprenyl-3-methyl-5-hydroxy-6-metoxy-1,4-benzoquinol methylase
MFCEKARYFLGALLNITNKDSACPFCSNPKTHMIRRKALVTSLWECDRCGLRFRMPKGNPQDSFAFYQKRYKQGFTTDCPSEQELKFLLDTNFSSIPKHYDQYIEVLKAAGLNEGDSLLDFGCSWGYGSWQMEKAGFRVYSYDVSQPRTIYAKTKLNCRIVEHLSDLPEKVKCFFSAHVIEHLDDPNIIWQAAVQVLDPQGIMVCFCPNGEPIREKISGSKKYHQNWSQKHPLLITRKALVEMSKHYGFSPYVFSSPFSWEEIRSRREPDRLTGDELLLIAVRQ